MSLVEGIIVECRKHSKKLIPNPRHGKPGPKLFLCIPRLLWNNMVFISSSRNKMRLFSLYYTPCETQHSCSANGKSSHKLSENNSYQFPLPIHFGGRHKPIVMVLMLILVFVNFSGCVETIQMWCMSFNGQIGFGQGREWSVVAKGRKDARTDTRQPRI